MLDRVEAWSGIIGRHKGIEYFFVCMYVRYDFAGGFLFLIKRYPLGYSYNISSFVVGIPSHLIFFSLIFL